MKKTTGFLAIVAAIATLHAGVAFAEVREISGEVVRVYPDKKQIILKVDSEGREREVEIVLKKDAALEGVPSLEALEKGTSVRVRADKKPFARSWIAERIAVVKSEQKRGLNSAETSDLHDLEQKSAQGDITPGQFEGRRQSLKPGKAIEF